MKYLKDTWKRVKTQNKIAIQFSKILKIILNCNLSNKHRIIN
jgi:hypothetical protein